MNPVEQPSFFRLLDGDLDIDGRQNANVRFVSNEADGQGTHITLISGPNGASKSRMLSSIVEHLTDLSNQSENGAKQSKRSRENGGLQWSNLRAEASPLLTRSVDLFHPLPSRALAISTIVTDKFPYHNNREQQDFYHYLGSRRSSNAVMIGAMGQAMAEAIIQLLPKPELFENFCEWTQLVFGRSCDIAFEFERLSRIQIEKFLAEEDKPTFIRNRTDKRSVRAGRREIDDQTAERIAHSTTRFFNFLLENGQESEATGSSWSRSKKFIIQFPTTNHPMAAQLQEIWSTFSDLAQAGYSPRPNVLVKFEDWIDFNSLSSGEQNILSTGAKLVAYSRPGCLIAIDEPEVSLNVAWQQKYVELVLGALKYAPGSHVLLATHSPHLVANLPNDKATVVTIEVTDKKLKFKTETAQFEGWGSETVLYEVLGISSASSFLFNREIAEVLRHVQESGQDVDLIDNFLERASKIETSEIEPLGEVLSAIKIYREQLS